MVFLIHIGCNIVSTTVCSLFLAFAVLALKFLQLDDIKRLEFKAHNISSNNHIKVTVYIAKGLLWKGMVYSTPVMLCCLLAATNPPQMK